jgi:hypothetical protein
VFKRRPFEGTGEIERVSLFEIGILDWEVGEFLKRAVIVPIVHHV